jgi:hypothetical protein
MADNTFISSGINFEKKYDELDLTSPDLSPKGL